MCIKNLTIQLSYIINYGQSCEHFCSFKEEAVKGGSCDALSLGNIILEGPVYEYQKPSANLNLNMQILREHFPMVEG